MMSLKNLQRPGRLLSLLAVAATLVSCGSDDNADPMASFTRQTLSWQTCPADWVDPALLEPLAGRTQCARMRAPIDYANPGKGEIEVALLRVAAKAPAQRQGAIYFNPGGPGNDGLPGPLIFSRAWSQANSGEAGALYKQLLQTYDLIGFSPRGTGASTHLNCSDSLDLRFVADPSRDRSQTNIDAMLYNDRLIANSCRDLALTPFINSDATARDMDLMRQLLGDDKFNYIGFSYGTWLGNWYASLFPERVGRMLLIGVTDFSKRLSDVTLPQEMAMQRVLDQVILPYAARHPEIYGRTVSTQELRQLLTNMPPALHAATVSALFAQGINKAQMIDTSVRVLRAAESIYLELKKPTTLNEADLRGAVSRFQFNPDKDRNSLARDMANSLLDFYFAQLRNEVPPERRTMQGPSATRYAVMCNDSGVGYTPETWVQTSNASVAQYPDFGGFWTENACLYWNGPSVTRPPQSAAASASGMLMLQSELDPWTPIEGAFTSFALLPNASLIQISGEYSHEPSLPYGKDCIDLPVARYLLEGRQPQRYSRCEGLPLSADASQ